MGKISTHPDHRRPRRNRHLNLYFQVVFIGPYISYGADYIIENKLIHGVSGIVMELNIGIDQPIAGNKNTSEIVGGASSIAIIQSGLLYQYGSVRVDKWGLQIRHETHILVGFHNLDQKRFRILRIILKK